MGFESDYTTCLSLSSYDAPEGPYFLVLFAMHSFGFTDVEGESVCGSNPYLVGNGSCSIRQARMDFTPHWKEEGLKPQYKTFFFFAPLWPTDKFYSQLGRGT